MTADSNWFSAGAAAMVANGRGVLSTPPLPPAAPPPLDGGARESSAPTGPRPGGDSDWVRHGIEAHRARGGLR